MTIAVLAPLLAYAVGRRLPVPLVVFEILLGVLVGPDVLDWARTDALVDGLSQLGLTMLIFLAGYEIEFGEVRGDTLRRAVWAWVAASPWASASGSCSAAATPRGLHRGGPDEHGPRHGPAGAAGRGRPARAVRLGRHGLRLGRRVRAGHRHGPAAQRAGRGRVHGAPRGLRGAHGPGRPLGAAPAPAVVLPGRRQDPGHQRPVRGPVRLPAARPDAGGLAGARARRAARRLRGRTDHPARTGRGRARVRPADPGEGRGRRVRLPRPGLLRRHRDRVRPVRAPRRRPEPAPAARLPAALPGRARRARVALAPRDLGRADRRGSCSTAPPRCRSSSRSPPSAWRTAS